MFLFLLVMLHVSVEATHLGRLFSVQFIDVLPKVLPVQLSSRGWAWQARARDVDSAANLLFTHS
jgi:hypothetical protein